MVGALGRINRGYTYVWSSNKDQQYKATDSDYVGRNFMWTCTAKLTLHIKLHVRTLWYARYWKVDGSYWYQEVYAVRHQVTQISWKVTGNYTNEWIVGGAFDRGSFSDPKLSWIRLYDSANTVTWSINTVMDIDLGIWETYSVSLSIPYSSTQLQLRGRASSDWEFASHSGRVTPKVETTISPVTL